MAVWLPVGDGFIAADVIRWKEPVFKNRRSSRPDRVGERLVIAEVLRAGDRDGWVSVLVRGSEVVSARIGWNVSDVLLPPTGKETKRKLTTIVRGNPERLAWSDESARAIVASRFLGPENPALTASCDLGRDLCHAAIAQPRFPHEEKTPRQGGTGITAPAQIKVGTATLLGVDRSRRHETRLALRYRHSGQTPKLLRTPQPLRAS